MPDNLASFKVFCAGGLNTSRDVLSQGETAPGSAIRLINYEPAITGGYRRISGFSNDYGTVTGTGSVLGVCVANGINDGILACRTPSSGNNYLHYWDATGGSWSAVTTSGSPTMTGVTKVRFEKYNWGSPKVILTDGINPAATYDGTTYTQITHAQAPTDPKYASAFKRHMFLAGDPAEPTNLYFSAPLDETDYDPANGAGVINVGFDVVAIKPFRDILYIFGLNNIKRLTGNNVANWVLEDVTSDLGCLSTDSVVEIGGDLLFYSQDGIRPIGGTDRIGDVKLETLSKNIQSILTEYPNDVNLDTMTAVLIREKSQFRLLFSAEEQTGIIGGLREFQGSIIFEFGQLLGITATCADSGYIGQNEFVVHGDASGKVHRQESGSDFDGDEIFSLYQTPYYHMQDPEQRKVFYNVSSYLRSEGSSSIVMGVVYDYEDFDTLSPSNYNLDTTGAAAYYGEAEYGSTAIFDGNPSPVQRTNISGSGYAMSVKYVTNSTDASHSIQGLVITFGVGDRR